MRTASTIASSALHAGEQAVDQAVGLDAEHRGEPHLELGLVEVPVSSAIRSSRALGSVRKRQQPLGSMPATRAVLPEGVRTGWS